MNIERINLFRCDNRNNFYYHATAHMVEELKMLGWNEDLATKHATSLWNPNTTLYALQQEYDKEREIFGWVEYIDLPEAIVFTFLYIKEAHRGNGLGEKALKQVIDMHGQRRIQSTVYLTNAASLKLHEKLGFKPVASYLELDNSPSEVE